MAQFRQTHPSLSARATPLTMGTRPGPTANILTAPARKVACGPRFSTKWDSIGRIRPTGGSGSTSTFRSKGRALGQPLFERTCRLAAESRRVYLFAGVDQAAQLPQQEP